MPQVSGVGSNMHSAVGFCDGRKFGHAHPSNSTGSRKIHTLFEWSSLGLTGLHSIKVWILCFFFRCLIGKLRIRNLIRTGFGRNAKQHRNKWAQELEQNKNWNGFFSDLIV